MSGNDLMMRALTFTLDCAMPPASVLDATCDFTNRRGDVFTAVEAEHFNVHSIGEKCADVTEGTGTGIGHSWERCRYDWSSPGSVTATVIDSNVYADGSSWTITAVAKPHGSRVEMTWVRQFQPNMRGRVFSALFRVAGRSLLGKYARQIVDNLEARRLG
jgi:hypothetical protein